MGAGDHRSTEPVTSPSGLSRWNQAWSGLGVTPPVPAVHAAILRGYDEAHRAYHTRRHLDECLSLLQEVRDLCQHPDEVALALWFHDAVYDPHQGDNEARSAAWLFGIAEEAGVDPVSIARMQALVMATCHAASPEGRDAQVLVDIDLAILGAQAERFDEYERQIRLEYQWVDETVYRKVRGKLLGEFLARAFLYSTPQFKQRFEAAARSNLERSIGQLLASA